jgi:hypothetical protein
MSGNSKGEPSAKSQLPNAGAFSDFVTRLLAVPHSKIKAQLDAEKEAKRIAKSVSRVSGGRAKRTQNAAPPTLPVSSA